MPTLADWSPEHLLVSLPLGEVLRFALAREALADVRRDACELVQVSLEEGKTHSPERPD